MSVHGWRECRGEADVVKERCGYLYRQRDFFPPAQHDAAIARPAAPGLIVGRKELLLSRRSTLSMSLLWFRRPGNKQDLISNPALDIDSGHGKREVDQ